jgi:hypothetical protein
MDDEDYLGHCEVCGACFTESEFEFQPCPVCGNDPED